MAPVRAGVHRPPCPVRLTSFGAKAEIGKVYEEMADELTHCPVIEVDGLPMDARSLPLDLQTVAFRHGYIPYIPALGPEGTAALMQR